MRAEDVPGQGDSVESVTDVGAQLTGDEEPETSVDGGPNRYAARRPVVGSIRVARFLTDLALRYRDGLATENATVNGEPGVIGFLNGEIDFVAAFEIEDSLVRTIRLIRNPDKLRLITSPAQLL